MIAILTLVLALPLGPGESVTVSCDPLPPRIFTVGDSVTQGSATAGGWPALLPNALVANVAIGGYTGAACLGLYKYNVKPFSPDAVAILCGINDLKNNSFSTPQQAFDAQLWMYDQALLNGAELWLISLLPTKYHGGICAPNTGTSCPHYHNGTGTHSVDHGVPCEVALQPADITGFNALLASYATTHPGAHYVDVYSSFLSNPLDPTSWIPSLYYPEFEGDRDCDGLAETDYVHPSLAGRQIIANVVAAAMGL